MQASVVETKSWRERLRVTRTGVFAIIFVLAGLLLLSNVGDYAADAITTLTFGSAPGGGTLSLDVFVRPYMIVVALIYIASGIISLVPVERLDRIKFWLLLLCGALIFPTVLIAAAVGQSTNATSMLASSMRLATPIVIGALAGIWCERAGVVNIAIEGMMLTGAAFGFIAFTLLLPSMDSQTAIFFGVIVAVLSGGLISALHAWLSITFKTDQIVSGTVINILALGLTSFLRREVLLQQADAGRETLRAIPIPILKDIPVVGEIFFQGKPIFYLMFILLIVTHVMLFYTRWGLRTRAVGENPHAADTLGINVLRNRWINVIIGGLIAGLAGAWLSLETTGTFDDNMTAGRGFIALAAMIFGKYLPFGAFGGGLLFGFSSALETRFQILGVELPPQFLQMIPYIVTIVVLAGLVGRSIPPKADGVPYEKE
ncbi:MAG: ABC transporter permease [Anaerolineae bacterium]|nr:ABC transporter permease [Anaerolineae bacterium]